MTILPEMRHPKNPPRKSIRSTNSSHLRRMHQRQRYTDDDKACWLDEFSALGGSFSQRSVGSADLV
jgi:hypothetical protein